MIIGEKENNSETLNVETPFSNTVVEDGSEFLALHFARLENLFNLMDRPQENGNCQTCEFSGMGRFFLQKFKEETEQVRQAVEKEFGKIQIARENPGKILGIIAVQPVPSEKTRSGAE